MSLSGSELVAAIPAYLFWRKRNSLTQFQAQDDPQTSAAMAQVTVSDSV
jgi:hypothetical protein